MSRNLEELYYHIEEQDQWLDSVIEKTQDLQTARLDIEAQFETLKVLRVILLYENYFYVPCW